jgi:hypothetical protein
MKMRDLVLGQVYAVKVSGRLQPVRLVAESAHGGWIGRNLQIGREVRIRSAAWLRFPVQQAPKTPPTEQQFQQDLTVRGVPY